MKSFKKIRRSHLEIIRDMLEVIDRRGHIKPTHLMYKANLSYVLLKKYLQQLTQKKLIKVYKILSKKKRQQKTIGLSEKGKEILVKLKNIKKLDL